MSKPNKKLSRHEPTKTKVEVAPAGTPTAASAPEVPLPITPEASPVMKAVGESLKTEESKALRDEALALFEATRPRTVTATTLRDDGPTLEEYVKAGYKAENYPPRGYKAKATITRTGGANWFIPPQRQSGFGMGGTK